MRAALQGMLRRRYLDCSAPGLKSSPVDFGKPIAAEVSSAVWAFQVTKLQQRHGATRWVRPIWQSWQKMKLP